MSVARARKLKDKALKFYGKGKYDKALLAYKEVVKADPTDLSSRLRLGDLYRKLDEPKRAMQAYREVSDFYAKDGFLLKAIAACKLVLEIDSQHNETQTLLAELYASKYGKPLPGQAIAAVTAPAPPAPITPISFESTPAIALEPEEDEGDEIEIDLDALGDEPVDISAVELPPMPEAPTHKDLPTIPLFSDLPQDAFIELMEQMKLLRVDPGEVVIRQGEQGRSFFIVATGTLRVYREVEGQEIDLARLGDGHFFGEMALLSEDPRTASVAAETECELFELSADLLDSLTSQYPRLEQALKRFYRQRLVSNTLATSPLFRPFSREDRKLLLGRFTAMEVPPGESIVNEGAVSGGLYLLVTGEVAITRGSGFQEVTLARLSGGEIFGEMSLIKGSEATATVRAIRPCTLLRLPPEAFKDLMMTHPQILEVVGDLSSERERQNAEVLGGEASLDEEGLLLF